MSLTARIPGSKSLTNRALAVAAMAGGTTPLPNPLVSDDTLAFAAGLRALGVPVEERAERWTVHGSARGPVGSGQRIWCQDAGTAARFLPPVAACGTGTFLFDGSDQLRVRPLGPLLDALRRLGARVEPFGAEDALPFRLTADGLAGGELTLPSHTSSQYLTGLLLAAPLMGSPLAVSAPRLVSRPYIDMTIALMARFGVAVSEPEQDTFVVKPGSYLAGEYRVEPDASTASYPLAAAALTGATVTVPDLGRDSLQGDRRFAEVLALTGAEVVVAADRTTVTGPDRLRGGFTVDMGDISDTFMTLAGIAPYADAPIRIEGVGHARLKESDRIEAVAGNLRACGITVRTGPDWLEIEPGTPRPALIRCHRDHRIAMSFSVLGLRTPGIELDDPSCVGKTFPGFHTELARLFGPR